MIRKIVQVACPSLKQSADDGREISLYALDDQGVVWALCGSPNEWRPLIDLPQVGVER